VRARLDVNVVALAAIAVLVLTLVVSGTRNVNVHTGDSDNLVAGTRFALDCIGDGTFKDCGDGAAVGSFGLLQYLPAAAFIGMGMSDATTVRALAWLSTLAFVALLAYTLARRRASSTVVAIVVLSGPLLLYSLLPYAEMLGAALGVAFLLACRARAPGIILAVGPFAMMGKETAAPFLLFAGWVCARERTDGWLPPRRVTVAIVTAAAGSLAAQAAFNVFRFGGITNEANNVSWSRVPGWSLRAKLAWALWAAPNVGIVWFWLAAALVLAGLVIVAIVQFRRSPRELRGWLPSAAVLALPVAMTVGLASWYSTFGWLAWGPRLSLSVLPVFVDAALHAGGDDMAAGLRWLVRTPAALAAVTVAVAALAVPHAGVVWNRQAIDLPTQPTEDCPRLLPVTEAEPAYFYGCGLASAWDDDPYYLVEAARGGQAPKLLAQIAVVVAIGALALRLRREVPAADPTAGVGSAARAGATTVTGRSP